MTYSPPTEADFEKKRKEAVMRFMDDIATGANPNQAWEQLCLLYGRYISPWRSVEFIDEGPRKVGVQR